MMTLEQIRRMACACVGPEYHQTGNARCAISILLASSSQTVEEKERGELLHPVSQVYFRAGLIACREYMARFVECESPMIAMSIRANWWPSLGKDYGPPRKLDWGEVMDGEYGAPDFRIRNADEVSPTQEALPIALGFLQQIDSGIAAVRAEPLRSGEPETRRATPASPAPSSDQG